MEGFEMPLDRETQLLIATGAAVASGCLSCLDNIVAKARAEGVDEKKLKAAALTGQYVKDQPMNHMKEHCDTLLGTHLGGYAPEGEPDCPMGEAESAQSQSAEADSEEVPVSETADAATGAENTGMPFAMMKNFMQHFAAGRMASCGCIGQKNAEGPARETASGCGCS